MTGADGNAGSGGGIAGGGTSGGGGIAGGGTSGGGGIAGGGTSGGGGIAGGRAGSGLLAHYDTVAGTRRAIEALRREGFDRMEVFSPVPAPELEVAMGIHSSPVRRWALLGGITGCLTGFLLTSGTSLAYPLVAQGKPIVALPPFIVIMFELTILLTGIFALVGMLVHARKPALRLAPAYREAFSVDRWGVFVAPGEDEEERARAEATLRETEPLELEPAGEGP